MNILLQIILIILLILLFPGNTNAMCYNPKVYPSNSEFINTATIGTRLYNTCNCGCCAECLKAKHLEYYLRTSAEYYNTINNGGFVYWETLTYNNECVPVLCSEYDLTTRHYTSVLKRGFDNYTAGKKNNFVDCNVLTFNRDDYRIFFKNLRSRLVKRGHGYKNIKYFFVSEYGDSIKGATLRPHYHCIFFVQNPNITPEILDTCIRSSWKFGQRFDEKPISQKILDGLGACNYVAKYVNKPADYIKLIDRYCANHHLNDYDKKLIMPFHVQSNGYGESLTSMDIKRFDIDPDKCYDLALKKGKCYIVDAMGKRTFPLPLYNIRKLFYMTTKDSQGKLHWELNDLGVQYKKNLQLDSLQKQVNRFQKQIDNINNLNALDKTDGISNINYKSLLYKMLDGRTAYDLAVYTKYFRYRIHHGFLPSLSETLKYDNESFFIDNALKYEAAQEPTSAAPSLYHNSKLGFFTHYDFNEFPLDDSRCTYNENKVKYKDFNAKYCIDQNTFTAFRYFDDIIKYLGIMSRGISEGETTKYLERENVKRRLNTYIQTYL